MSAVHVVLAKDNGENWLTHHTTVQTWETRQGPQTGEPLSSVSLPHLDVYGAEMTQPEGKGVGVRGKNSALTTEKLQGDNVFFVVCFLNLELTGFLNLQD